MAYSYADEFVSVSDSDGIAAVSNSLRLLSDSPWLQSGCIESRGWSNDCRDEGMKEWGTTQNGDGKYDSVELSAPAAVKCTA